ncbi:MAG: hypothetical protein H6512_01015 [Acidimicrobiia bacterium]|nr:hypothetical protein [Acidimicrobiia bacterium]
MRHGLQRPSPLPHLYKAASQNIAKKGDVLSYDLYAGTSDGSIPMENATLVDLLPEGVSYVEGSWTFKDYGWGSARRHSRSSTTTTGLVGHS